MDKAVRGENRFNGFPHCVETVETFLLRRKISAVTLSWVRLRNRAENLETNAPGRVLEVHAPNRGNRVAGE